MLSLSNLNQLQQDFYQEIRDRGTLSVLKKDGDSVYKTEKTFSTYPLFSKFFKNSTSKGIEIFNGTAVDLDLSTIQIKKIKISDSSFSTFTYSGTLFSGSTYLAISTTTTDLDVINRADLISSDTIFNPTVNLSGYKYELYVGGVLRDNFTDSFTVEKYFERFETILNPIAGNYLQVSQWFVLSTLDKNKLGFHETQHYNNSKLKTIDGEFLRLIEYNRNEDMFLYSVGSGFNTNFVIGKQSPLYKGVSYNKTLNMSWNESLNIDYLSILKYPLTNLSSYNIFSITGTKETYLNFTLSSTEKGIGSNGSFIQQIFINPFIDYEISFLCRFVETNLATLNIRSGAVTFDINGTQIYLQNANSSTDNNNLYYGNVNQQSVWYKITGYIFGVNKIYDPSFSSIFEMGNVGGGIHKEFKSEEVRFIAPYFYFSNINGGAVDIKGIEIKPLSTDYNTSFIQGSKINQFWLQNNNKKLSVEEIKDISDEFLFPLGYKSIYNLLPINEFGEDWDINWVGQNTHFYPEGFKTKIE